MRTGQVVLLVSIWMFSLGVNNRALAQTNESGSVAESASPQGVRSATVLTIHGKISAVDPNQGTVTIDVNGRTVPLKIENPVNLQAAKVGDPVVVRYYEIVSIRKKKAGEDVPSVSVKDGITTARPGGPAGAVASQEAKVLVTVNSVDLANGTVTIQGPDGGVETVKARNPKNLRHIKAGDQLVVSISRATAISLEKDTSN